MLITPINIIFPAVTKDRLGVFPLDEGCPQRSLSGKQIKST
jgi:hypothetical protein